MSPAFLLALLLQSPGEPTIEHGKALFGEPTLSTNGRSCASCHSGGKLFDGEEIAAATSKDLAVLANHCVTLRLAGPKLDNGSEPLVSIALYVKTFQRRH